MNLFFGRTIQFETHVGLRCIGDILEVIWSNISYWLSIIGQLVAQILKRSDNWKLSYFYDIRESTYRRNLHTEAHSEPS